MNKTRMWLLLLAAVVVAGVGVVELTAKPAEGDQANKQKARGSNMPKCAPKCTPAIAQECAKKGGQGAVQGCPLAQKYLQESEQKFVVHEVPEHVVLYRIYRGPYEQVGPAVSELFTLAGTKGLMPPQGPVSYAYLNNPELMSSKHLLTEIRMPVSKDALKLAGTLGPMTDIKKLPATKVAVAVKPEGMADPGSLYGLLYNWTIEQGYMAIDAPAETFLTNTMSGDYARMKSRIAIPIAPLGVKKPKSAVGP